MMTQKFDIAIVGGGLAGLTQAILLGNQGHKVVCIDREKPITQTDETYDIRTTAISWGSRNLLTHAGVWDDMVDKAECIKDIVILDEDSPIELDFISDEIGAEGFGWIVDNRDLRQTLFNHVQSNDNITHLTGQSVTDFKNHETHVDVILDDGEMLQAKLVIGVDGRKSFTRDYMGIKTWSKDYNQTALVCLMTHTKPHDGVAVEHFRAQGPFAVLPFTDDANGNYRSAIVWTVEEHEANEWLNCPDEVFNAALQTRCGDRFGDVKMIGNRAGWPLNVVKAHSYIGDRMVIAAESAHGMHPIAGQGLNMSLRDIAVITELLDGVNDPGNAAILRQYQSMRRKDNVGMVAATDILNELFGSNISAIRGVRRFGLHAVSKIPFARKFFMKQAMGAVGNMPTLIKGVG